MSVQIAFINSSAQASLSSCQVAIPIMISETYLFAVLGASVGDTHWTRCTTFQRGDEGKQEAISTALSRVCPSWNDYRVLNAII